MFEGKRLRKVEAAAQPDGCARIGAGGNDTDAGLGEEAAYRVGVAAMVMTMATGLGLAIALTLDFGIGGSNRFADPTIPRIFMVANVLVSGAVWYAARCGHLCKLGVLRVGLVYEVALAFSSFTIGHLAGYSPEIDVRGMQWGCAAILTFPLIIPAPWRARLTTTLLAAAASPVALGIVALTGGTLPAGDQYVAVFLPPFLCAGIALGAARVISRWHEKVVEVQEELAELGSYRLVEKLGEGGMGEVWRAEHRMLARPAAVKLIKPDRVAGAASDEAERNLKRFEREAQTTARLRSLHTVELYDFGTLGDGSFYYVMELLDGVDLQKLIRESGPLPASRVIHFLLHACDSLGEAHAAGLIHRDLKPANLVACRLGLAHDVLKVLDFGLVLNVGIDGAGADPRLTQKGFISGTPPFMAPEMAMGKDDVDSRADIYALGCIGYFLLTGKYLFDAKTPVEMLLAHVKDVPTTPSMRVAVDVPGDLEQVVMDCLEKDRADRPGWVTELTSLLRACQSAGDWTPERAAEWWAKRDARAAG